MTVSEHSRHLFYKSFNLWHVDRDFADPMFNYLVYGFSPGSCFTAVLANDFLGAMSSSHPSNTVTAFKALAGWIRDCMPRRAYGSYEAVDIWLAMPEQERRDLLVLHNLVYTPKQETFLAIRGEPA